MPKREFHIDKAQRNETFYQSHNLGVSPFTEWATVVLFYAAVHYVDAVLSQEVALPSHLQHPTDHATRNSAVSKSPCLTPIADKYMNLYHRSRDARYTQISFPEHYFKQLEQASFRLFQRHVREVLGLP